jgi:hypothetical protein
MRIFLCLPKDYSMSKRVRHDTASLTNGGPPQQTPEMDEAGLAWFEAELSNRPFSETHNAKYAEQARYLNSVIDELRPSK